MAESLSRRVWTAARSPSPGGSGRWQSPSPGRSGRRRSPSPGGSGRWRSPSPGGSGRWRSPSPGGSGRRRSRYPGGRRTSFPEGRRSRSPRDWWRKIGTLHTRPETKVLVRLYSIVHARILSPESHAQYYYPLTGNSPCTLL